MQISVEGTRNGVTLTQSQIGDELEKAYTGLQNVTMRRKEFPDAYLQEKGTLAEKAADAILERMCEEIVELLFPREG